MTIFYYMIMGRFSLIHNPTRRGRLKRLISNRLIQGAPPGYHCLHFSLRGLFLQHICYWRLHKKAAPQVDLFLSFEYFPDPKPRIRRIFTQLANTGQSILHSIKLCGEAETPSHTLRIMRRLEVQLRSVAY